MIAGHRRLAAARAAGLRVVPCVVRGQHTRIEHTQARLIENGHRRGLNPLQQARGFDHLRRSGMSQTDIAARTGFSSGHVSARLALLDLDPETQARVEAGRLSPEAAVTAIRGTRRGDRPPAHRRGRDSGHLSASHPLAAAVADRCGHGRTEIRIGGVGCGLCWEEEIRADERASGTDSDPSRPGVATEGAPQ